MNVNIIFDIPLKSDITNCNGAIISQQVLEKAFREIDDRPISFLENDLEPVVNGMIHSAKIIEEQGELFVRCKGILFYNIIPECQIKIIDNKIADMRIVGFDVEK